MIPRRASSAIVELGKGYPIVAITGPRQSGKTTLARSVFAEKPYVSLEDLDAREFSRSDPRGFLRRFPDGAVIDEAQRDPALFSYLQGIVDADSRAGLFVLTGSEQFGLSQRLSQSLAGRVAIVHLLPFSLAELDKAGRRPETLERALWKGLYPPLYDRDLEPSRWYGNYVETYVERDVRQVVNIRDLDSFRRFVRMCAARTGQLANYSSLADDCGVSPNTIRSWLSVLEASYLITFVPPHFRNFGKRLVNTPKLHFLDTGLACRLLGIERPEDLDVHPMRGPLFESLIVTELLKSRFDRGLPSNLFFWRDRGGHEIDILLEHGRVLDPVEVKSSRTVSSDAFRFLDRWRRIADDAAGAPTLVYAGEEGYERGGVRVCPWYATHELATDD